MATDKRIRKNKTRKMMGETHVDKPFRTRVRTKENDKVRVEWVWQDDMMVPVNVRSG